MGKKKTGEHTAYREAGRDLQTRKPKTSWKETCQRETKGIISRTRKTGRNPEVTPEVIETLDMKKRSEGQGGKKNVNHEDEGFGTKLFEDQAQRRRGRTKV